MTANFYKGRYFRSPGSKARFIAGEKRRRPGGQLYTMREVFQKSKAALEVVAP